MGLVAVLVVVVVIIGNQPSVATVTKDGNAGNDNEFNEKLGNSSDETGIPDKYNSKNLNTDWTDSGNQMETVVEELEQSPEISSSERAKDYELPEDWKPFCSVTKEKYESKFTNQTHIASVSCKINASYSGVWSMTDLRVNLNRYNDTEEKYSFDIVCTEGANISLFYPMKVNNLFKLRVKSCLLVGFLSEYDNDIITIIPDSLRVLELSDVQVLISIHRLIGMLKNVKNTPKEYNCGHETTVEKLVSRNISFIFLEPPETVIHNLVEIGEQFLLDSKRITHKCDYQHLMHLDESVSSSMSIYHINILTENSIYYELQTYNLSYNHIRSLKDSQLQWSVYFPKLELYDLSHNDISGLYRFEIPLHKRMDQITTINLQYNNITSFTVKDLERFKQMPMVFIDLRNNPLFCNCTESFKELLEFVHKKEYLKISNLTDYSYIKDMRCAGPDAVKGKTLESLLVTNLPCRNVTVTITESETEYFVVPVIALSITVVALAVILFLILRFRKEVLIILYTRFHIILPCQSRNWNDDKKYDAFVSYSSSDEDFVGSLFERLEQPPEDSNTKAFKFCLHHRDFVLGKTIFSNVCNSVESSRHTIILLSKKFIKSQYCLYEFQEAFRQSIMEKKRHLIIIMMEDVPTEELPTDLRRCIKTFTYIRKDDYLFDDRLIYALSVKQKSKSVNELKTKTSVSYTNGSTNSNAKINQCFDSSEGDSISKPKKSKSNRPQLTLSANTLLNENFEYNTNDLNQNDKVTVINEINKINATDVDYDRCISTGSTDTGYGSDFNPSPTSTICSSPTYLKNGQMPPGEIAVS